jgi:DNA-directed RNA polymerase subunit M/transcription elongation factor TFIIS
MFPSYAEAELARLMLESVANCHILGSLQIVGGSALDKSLVIQKFMARRKAYTEVYKKDQVRADHVKGMGDVVFKGFQCLNPECQEFLLVRKDDISEFFEIPCPTCEFVHKYGEESKFYDYELRDLRDDSIIKEGNFTILHDDYIDEAEEFKYCIICNALKPLDLFDRHSARKSKRQGECRLCKAVYNELKNPTRIMDQHREAAQKRRLYMELTGGSKIDSKEIYKRFDYKCFKCQEDLSQDIQEKSVQRGGNLDHTLPAKYLWPLTNDNATLLCQRHNAEKAEKWPSEFYTHQELKRLVLLTGIPYDTLAAKPFYNPEALKKLHGPGFVDTLLTKYAAYMDEMIMIRNRILDATGLDMFAISKTLSKEWITEADKRRR